MHINNETGVIQDIEAIGSICRERDVLFHVDAAQSVGKLPIDLDVLPVDLLSTTAHKIYGPQGIGALYIADRPGCHVEPLLYGGGQQRALRPGTLAAALIVGFGNAAEIAHRSMHDGIVRNGSADASFPGILNVSIDDVEGESLLLALEPISVATGSACNAKIQEPSYVLRALGLSDEMAQSAIRFSFGRPTTAAEIDLAADLYRRAVERLRALAPRRTA
jgi:cysteine desulfurase